MQVAESWKGSEYEPADTQILVRICRATLTGDASVDCSQIDADRWHGITAAALQHGLIYPLHCFLARAESCPENVAGTVKTLFLQQAVRNYRLTDALLEVLRTFDTGGVDVLVVKGPAAALITAGKLAAREFTDLDLLVRLGDLKRAETLLLQLGYSLVAGGDSLGITGKHIQFVRDSDNLLAELHWRLAPRSMRFPIDESGVWNRSQVLHVQNGCFATLSVEDTVLALCIHGLWHGWYSLKWVFDIAQLIARQQGVIDWRVLLERCNTADCTRVLLIGIRVASDLFCITPPAVLSGSLDDPSIVKPAELIRTSLLNDKRLSQREVILLLIQSHNRFWNRLFAGVSVSVPELPQILPESWTPVKSGPLRFITRPVRLLHLYGFTWLRAVLGR